MVNRSVHLEQVAAVVGINIDLLRSLNPMYRRDIIPGNTEPMPLRLPLAEVSKFIDMEDSVYNYKTDELLTKRIEVAVNDDVPTYYHKSKRYSRGKRGARYGKHRAARGGKRHAASRKKSSGRKSRKSTRRRR
jgi:membrane-bound lytic murein transglycosylase D